MARCLRCRAGNEWIEGNVHAEPAEALALLRELNDALVIPGWLQPRVDAVLDKTDTTPTRKWCIYTRQFDCTTLGDCNDNGCQRNRSQ